MGGASILTLPSEVVRLANQHLHHYGYRPSFQEEEKVQIFFRAEKQNLLLYSAKYRRVKLRNSFTVQYTNKSGEQMFGLIQYFFVPNSHFLPLVAVRVLHQHTESLQDNFGFSDSTVNSLSRFLVPVSEPSPSQFDVTDLDRIVEKCLYISFPEAEFSDRYIVRFPHRLHD